MPARARSTAPSTLRSSRASKEKAKRTIRTAIAPKVRSSQLSEVARESSGHTPSPISRPAVASVEGGEFSSSDQSPWEGLPQPNRPVYHYELMGDVERMVR